MQGVARVVGTHARKHNPGCLPLTLTTEVGIVGGFPAGGLRFGASHSAAAAIPLASMLDFYNGGGADVACLGMAEVPSPALPHIPGAHPERCRHSGRMVTGRLPARQSCQPHV